MFQNVSKDIYILGVGINKAYGVRAWGMGQRGLGLGVGGWGFGVGGGFDFVAFIGDFYDRSFFYGNAWRVSWLCIWPH